MVNRRIRTRDDGASGIEYGLIAALVAAVLISIVSITGVNLSTVYCSVAGKVGTATGVDGPCNDIGGGIDNPTDPVVSPNLPYPWLPPSWVVPNTGDPTKIRRGLGGGEPGIVAPAEWQYGADSHSLPAYGASRIRIVGDQITGFTMEVVTGCVVGSWGAGSGGEDGCAPSLYVGTYSTSGYTIAMGVCEDGAPVTSIAISGGFIQGSHCATHGGLHSLTITGRVIMPGYATQSAIIVTSTWTVAAQLTTQLVCQQILSGVQQTIEATGNGSAAAATCPDGWLPVGFVVNGDITMLDGRIAPVSLADWINYGKDFADWHLESNGASCALKNSSGTSVSLVTSDCATARDEGLF